MGERGGMGNAPQPASGAETPIDASLCPLCGASNRCVMAAGQPELRCWCVDVSFSAELLARVPPQAVNRACLCPACAGALPPGSSDPGSA